MLKKRGGRHWKYRQDGNFTHAIPMMGGKHRFPKLEKMTLSWIAHEQHKIAKSTTCIGNHKQTCYVSAFSQHRCSTIQKQCIPTAHGDRNKYFTPRSIGMTHYIFLPPPPSCNDGKFEMHALRVTRLKLSL